MQKRYQSSESHCPQGPVVRIVRTTVALIALMLAVLIAIAVGSHLLSDLVDLVINGDLTIYLALIVAAVVCCWCFFGRR